MSILYTIWFLIRVTGGNRCTFFSVPTLLHTFLAIGQPLMTLPFHIMRGITSWHQPPMRLLCVTDSQFKALIFRTGWGGHGHFSPSHRGLLWFFALVISLCFLGLSRNPLIPCFMSAREGDDHHESESQLFWLSRQLVRPPTDIVIHRRSITMFHSADASGSFSIVLATGV